MRVDLGEGRWAELHESLTHDMFIALEKAAFTARHGVQNGEYPESFTTSVILVMTKEWSLGELSRTSLGTANYRLVDVLYEACNEAYKTHMAELVVPQA